MSKRHRFVIASILLSIGFIGISFLSDQSRLTGIFGLTLLAILLFYWSLYETIGRNATLLSIVLPAMFTFGVGLFWFLLPSTFFARLPVVVMYGVGMYALISTSNIFNVSIIKSIALARAAKGVGFVLTLFTSFLLYDAILSLRSNYFFTVASVIIVSFPLLLQGLWVSKLEKNIEKEQLVYAGVLAYAVGTVSMILYFWPVTIVVGSLFLTVTMYVLLGLAQSKIEGRLFKSTLKEYLLVGVLVFLAMIFATHWRG